MHDKELYQQILGLRKPWVVEGVEVKKESQEVVVHVGLEGPNHAERVLRRAVIWRKRSFGADSDDGCRFVERVLTAVMSRRLQKLPVLPFLEAAIRAQRSGERAPSLLPA